MMPIALRQPFMSSYPWSSMFWRQDDRFGAFSPWGTSDDNRFLNGSKDSNVEQTRFRAPYGAIGSRSPSGINSLSNSSKNILGSTSNPSEFIPPKVRRRPPTQMECVFCKNNDVPPEKYRNHILKDPTGKILCPVLRAYNCPICNNGGGDFSHTTRYCPQNRASRWASIQSAK